LNNIEDPDMILVGQQLNIPEPSWAINIRFDDLSNSINDYSNMLSGNNANEYMSDSGNSLSGGFVGVSWSNSKQLGYNRIGLGYYTEIEAVREYSIKEGNGKYTINISSDGSISFDTPSGGIRRSEMLILNTYIGLGKIYNMDFYNGTKFQYKWGGNLKGPVFKMIADNTHINKTKDILSINIAKDDVDFRRFKQTAKKAIYVGSVTAGSLAFALLTGPQPGTAYQIIISPKFNSNLK
jgi:hypothetical protein